MPAGSAEPAPQARGRLELLEQLSAKLQASIDLQVEILGLANALAQRERESRAMAVLNVESSSEFIDAKEAGRIAGITAETIKDWAGEHGFGWRSVTAKGTPGHWMIHRDMFLEHLKSRAATKRKS